jgi:outer membrane protein assembly factor BamE (lipoprotein component of BamABCDE complex)
MKKLHLTLTCLLLSAAAAVFALSGCDKGGAPVTNTRITAANVAKIQPGMDRTQVEALLGPPTTSETKDMIIFKKTTATYVEGKQSVEVIYKNNEVEEVHSTVGAAGSPGADTTSSTTTTTTTTKP